jgi:alpha-1,3-rhamnosyl/mannosyltransferase
VSLYHEPATFPLPYSGRNVVTVHDLSWIRYPQTHPEDRRRTLERDFPALLRRASHVLTDSSFVKTELISEFGLQDTLITTAPLAARSAFSPRARRESAPLLDRLRLRYRSFFLSVGTLEPRKNLLRTMRAYAGLPSRVRQRNPLVLIGGVGWESEDIEAEVRTLASRGEILALGYVAEDQLALLYSAARALVYASLYEGFGLPPLEAMASGTPVIAGNTSALPEVVDTAGVLVDPFDEAEIRDSMLRLAEDEALADTLSTRGLERSRQFSWKSCAALTRAVYHQVLQSP